MTMESPQSRQGASTRTVSPGKSQVADVALEAALREPFLLAPHGHPVLRGQVVEGREGGDVVRLGMQPSNGIGLHHREEELSPLLDGQAHGPSELGIVQGASALHERAHEKLEGPIEEPRIGHGV
jgi:hypothetical protein